MFATVTRATQRTCQRLSRRRLRHRLERTGAAPVVVRRRVWELHSAHLGPNGLTLGYRGPGGVWQLRMPGRDHTGHADRSGRAAPEVTVVFPDGCLVRCVGTPDGGFVPQPPHSASVAALLPPMMLITTDRLARLLDSSGVPLEIGGRGPLRAAS